MDTSIWKPIPGYEGRYEVSSTGYVRSVERYINQGGCIPSRHIKARLLRKVRGGRALNYHRVMLESPKRHAYLHVLVLEAFVGPRPPGMLACHRDDNGFNNRADNLYWGTVADNMADRRRNAAPDPDPEPIPEPVPAGGLPDDDGIPF